MSPLSETSASDSFYNVPIRNVDLESSSFYQAEDQRQMDSENIDLAVNSVGQCIENDNKFPELADKLNIVKDKASGLHETAYPDTFDFLSNTMTQMKSINKVPTPNEILEQYSRVHCHSIMGTFAAIRRAWLVLDSDLFLWDFETGSDVAYYDGVSEVIVTVGLVKPRLGVFQDFVNYLLVLATPSNIIVLGVTFSSPNNSATEEMHITQEVVYMLPTDGVMFSTIVGSDDGRIFMGAKDGCLYEFVYQKEISWWGKRCKKINHSNSTLSVLIPSFLNIFQEVDEIIQIVIDDSRKILYTLSAKGSIEIYFLGEAGDSMTKQFSFSNVHITNSVIRIMDESSLLGPVISISALERPDSVRIPLVATMESGTRLYFSCYDGMFAISHVRMPPGYTGCSPLQRPSKIRTAIYNKDTCLMINAAEGCQDKLWSLSSDFTPFSVGLSETLTIAPLDGVVWSLERFEYNGLITCTFPEPPLIVTQHYESTSKYVFLTDKGAEIFQKLRPVDIIREMLEEGHDPGSEVLRRFLHTMPDDEICANLLLLACLRSYNEQVSSIATRGFFMYAGEPKLAAAAPQLVSPSSLHNQRTLGFQPESVSTPVGVGQRQFYQSPNQQVLNTQWTLQHSHKHNGLYLFLARTMRPLWEAKVVHCDRTDGRLRCSILAITIHRINLVANHLAALANFLELNPNVMTVPTLSQSSRGANDMNTPHSNRKVLQDLYLQEKKSLIALKLFVSRASETLNLWKVLYDHQFHILATTLSLDDLNFLETATFRNLILSGSGICNSLINKLISLYLDDNTSVDAITTKLRDVCPSLFLHEDAACAKAVEMIMFVRGKIDIESKQKLLYDSLKILSGVCPKINLSAICSQYLDIGFYDGIFQLTELCAKSSDPKDLGLQYYRNGGQPYSAEHMAYVQRMNFYKELTITLDHLHGKQTNAPQTSLNNTLFAMKNNSFLSSTTNIPDYLEFINMCMSSGDELLHSAIYAWMVDKKLNSELVALGRPTLDYFLQKSTIASQQFTSPDVKEILWMFLENQGDHVGAAEVLYTLAKEQSSSIPLDKRIHYLSHALVCMKSTKSGAAPHVGVLYQEVEDNLRVAQIQLRIQKHLPSVNLSKEQAAGVMAALNSKLYNLTELYEEFAEEFDLSEIKLSIIDCSSVSTQNDEIIKEIWQSIIDTELKKCVSNNADDLLICVVAKIKSVLKNVCQNSPIFCEDFLIEYLEIVSCRLGASKHFVHTMMSDLGVPVQKIADVYDRLYVQNNPCWEENGDEYHIIASIGSFAGYLVKNNRIPSIQKKQTSLKLNDLITHCLNLLYSRSTKENVDALIRSLKSVQECLNRY